MVDSQHWMDGKIVDGEPRPEGSPWAWLATIVLLVLAVDWALGLGEAAELPTSEIGEVETVELRDRLQAAVAAAREGRPALLLVGDSVLAGDVMAASVPDWDSQRVIDHMRRELGTDSDALLQQIALDGLLPIDALHVLAELDRLDPAGEVRFVLELNLRYFSTHYARQTWCTRPPLCELGRGQLAGDDLLARAGEGLLESAGVVHDALRRRAPIRRHRPRLDRPELAALDGLAVPRASERSDAARVEGLARVQAHYRDLALKPDHAQVEALIELVDRLHARRRPAALFLTPLEDDFEATTAPSNQFGRLHEQLAQLIHDRSPTIELLDLDHPLFESAYFLDHVHLGPEGNRLLALNLLHELGLPLRTRPFEWMMVHPEDHDRSLIHRRRDGFADGGAWRALLHKPEGVAVSRAGDWIVIADTDNHVLRQLRGSMQIVERLAGTPRRVGSSDGRSDAARLERPRSPEIVGDAVYFLDGRRRARVRAVVRGRVETPSWSGPDCDAVDQLEAQVIDGRPTLFLLCADDRVLLVDLVARTARLGFDPHEGGGIVGVHMIEPTDDGRLLLADRDSQIWSITLDDPRRPPERLFDNAGPELRPSELAGSYPFGFEQLRLNRIVGMEWVERYGMLLVQDEHDHVNSSSRLRREMTERVHLRLLDLDERLIYPWIKAIPHADAFHLWNDRTDSLASYFHLGAMAVVQSDASLIYLEQTRSRLLRIADGLLAAAKSGNLLEPMDTRTAEAISARLRPDRFLATRHEPIPREGPYVAVLIGSSLSSVSDRIGSYSLARLLELELQAELGYRDGVRLDLFQRSVSPSSLRSHTEALEQFLAAGPAPDLILIELHDLQRRFFHDTPTRGERLAELARLEQLAERHDSLLMFFDNSALASEGRDGLRASSAGLIELIADIRERGHAVLEPSDLLLRELLVESPWGNQPWDRGQHHGAPWAIELTAKALAGGVYPPLREFLCDRRSRR